MELFDFFLDMGNYEDRKVARFEANWGFVDTVAVSDGRQPFETAVCHERYREGGDMVIVEAYDTKDEAQVGHDKWVKVMTAKKLPVSLTDCANAEIGGLCAAIGGEMVYPLKKKVSR